MLPVVGANETHPRFQPSQTATANGSAIDPIRLHTKDFSSALTKTTSSTTSAR